MRKGLISLVAAVALAAFALPASAGVGLADLQASGFYHGFAIMSNFLDSGGGPSLRNSSEEQTNSYLQQRFRVKWTFGTESVKAVWYLESDMQWGDTSGSSPQPANRNKGGALGADKVQTETKNIYVWFKIPNTSIQATFGLHGVGDSYSGLFASKGGCDMSAIEITGKYAPVAYRFVFGKLYEGVPQISDDVTLWMAEGKFKPTKDVKAGINFYFLQDDSGKTDTARMDPSNAAFATSPVNGYKLRLYMPGFDVAAKVGPVKLAGWFFYQTGKFEAVQPGLEDIDVSAFAINASADMKVGPGRVHVEGVYLSGGDNSGNDYKAPLTLGDYQSRGYNIGPGGYSGYSKLHTTILLPDWKMATVSQCIIGCSGGEMGDSPGNAGRGIWAIGGRYSQKITKTVKGEVNIVHMEATHLLVGDTMPGKDMGTEFNGVVSWSPYKGLAIEGIGAYAVLGDFIKHETPGDDFVDPWNTMIRVAYSY